MAVQKSYAPLGLFLVVGLAVVLATALFFIQRLRRREVITMVTYTRENVSGLEVSSPVRYRGVSLGRITDVRVDPRSNSIEVDFEVFLHRLVTVGANVERVQSAASGGGIFENLRAQIVRNPVTGEAYLLLDRPENAPPPMSLGFTPDRAYVPTMPTMLSKVEDRLPEVLERATVTLQNLREIIARVPSTLDRSERFFTSIQKILQESDIPALSADSRKFLTTTSTQLAQIERITTQLNRLIESQEAFARFVDDTRATLKAADLPATTQSARDSADDLRRSLPAMRDSLEELRQLARFIGEQPESVVYGARPSGVKPK